MSAQNQKSAKPSAKARALSARLSAVQAIYQHMQNDGQSLGQVIDDYLGKRAGMEINGETLVEPDGALMKKIVKAVAERKDELEEIIKANLKGKEDKSRKTEPLLQAILLAGTCELLVHQDIDYPVIINDYLHVTHAFYDKVEAGLVNGVLDPIAKLLRE